MKTLEFNVHDHHKIKPLMLLVASTGIVEFFQIKFYPDISLLQWLGIVVIVDFLSAFYRAICLNETRNSKKVRATIPKVFGYFGSMLVVVIVENVFNFAKGGAVQEALTRYFNNLFILLMVYAEVLSVLENIIMVNRKDLFTEWVMIPIYRILTAQFTGNIVSKIDKGTGKTKDIFNEKKDG